MTPPVIEKSFNVCNKIQLGAYVSLPCSASGNPAPTITWYRNGQPIQFDYLISYQNTSLIIQSYEEEHKGLFYNKKKINEKDNNFCCCLGFYQCVARNEAGETESSGCGLLSWMNREYAAAPKNLQCYPYGQDSMLISFDTDVFVRCLFTQVYKLQLMFILFFSLKWEKLVYYTANETLRWSSSAETRQSIGSRYLLSHVPRQPFQVFTLFVKTLSNMGVQDNTKELFDMSRLSSGVRCAMQARKFFFSF